MGEFNRDGLLAKNVGYAEQAASHAGHALGMASMLSIVSPKRVPVWEAEHVAWAARRDKIISSCVFLEDSKFIATAATTKFQIAYDAVFDLNILTP